VNSIHSRTNGVEASCAIESEMAPPPSVTTTPTYTCSLIGSGL
jgi:hypothetical protein